MNTNGAPNCTCKEEGRKGAKGTEWAEFRFDPSCPFHFPGSTTHEKEENNGRSPSTPDH